MDLTIPPGLEGELSVALLQAVVTAALAVVAWSAYYRTPKPHLQWWGVTWSLYTVRMGAILSFALTEQAGWLFWHQVLTGWTAISLLGAALSFSRPHESHRQLWLWALFPVVWSYVAIYRLDVFLLAAGPAVAFLSLATLGAARAFWLHHRRVTSPAARFLAWALALWALHHLDYPFLRARGAWVPWGYYLDLLFQGAAAFGILFLVLDDHRLGLSTLARLGAKVLGPAAGQDFMRGLLEELRRIPGVEGAALVRFHGTQVLGVEGVGALEAWEPSEGWVVDEGRPSGAGPRPSLAPAERGGLLSVPVTSPEGQRGALVVSGPGRHGLVALTDEQLLTVGQQVGIAWDKADLAHRLLERTRDLERLAAATVGRQEAERRRISRELHDETAQALAAVRMRLALLQEELDPSQAPLLADTAAALQEAIASIRRVASRLRPAVLDELGLVPALRALARDFSENSDVVVEFEDALEGRPPEGDVELTVFRSVQEGLANAIRHSGAGRVVVRLRTDAGALAVDVMDDGGGAGDGEGVSGPAFGTGLIGMRERVTQLGGEMSFRTGDDGGHLSVRIPVQASGAIP